MGLEENIIFIKSQLDLYRAMLGSASDSLDLIKVRYQSLREEIQEQRSKIRSLKRDLLRPTTSPARSELEEIVRLEARLERWQTQQEKVDGVVDGLRAIAREWARARAELKDLGPGDLTASDQSKINAFQNTIQSLLARFRFQSFRASDITLSPDDFRPQVVTEDEDGERVVKDIGFEASASDGIRLKWAYILALTQLSKSFETNHVGFSVFDEPGQQQMRELDLAAFFEASAQSAGTQRQILVTTSEVLERVNAALQGVEATIHSFEGFILKAK
jgi:prefoldin subunit 5